MAKTAESNVMENNFDFISEPLGEYNVFGNNTSKEWTWKDVFDALVP